MRFLTFAALALSAAAFPAPSVLDVFESKGMLEPQSTDQRPVQPTKAPKNKYNNKNKPALSIPMLSMPTLAMPTLVMPTLGMATLGFKPQRASPTALPQTTVYVPYYISTSAAPPLAWASPEPIYSPVNYDSGVIYNSPASWLAPSSNSLASWVAPSSNAPNWIPFASKAPNWLPPQSDSPNRASRPSNAPVPASPTPTMALSMSTVTIFMTNEILATPASSASLASMQFGSLVPQLPRPKAGGSSSDFDEDD